MKYIDQPQQAERNQQEGTGIPTGQEAAATPQRPAHLATTRGIVAYLLLAFGLAWALWIPAWLLPREGNRDLPVMPCLPIATLL